MSRIERTGAYRKASLADSRVLSLVEHFGMIASPLLKARPGCE